MSPQITNTFQPVLHRSLERHADSVVALARNTYISGGRQFSFQAAFTTTLIDPIRNLQLRVTVEDRYRVPDQLQLTVTVHHEAQEPDTDLATEIAGALAERYAGEHTLGTNTVIVPVDQHHITLDRLTEYATATMLRMARDAQQTPVPEAGNIEGEMRALETQFTLWFYGEPTSCRVTALRANGTYRVTLQVGAEGVRPHMVGIACALRKYGYRPEANNHNVSFDL